MTTADLFILRRKILLIRKLTKLNNSAQPRKYHMIYKLSCAVFYYCKGAYSLKKFDTNHNRIMNNYLNSFFQMPNWFTFICFQLSQPDGYVCYSFTNY